MTHAVYLSDGRRFDVAPGETVLAAAQRAGIRLASGCQSGTCGSCRARLLDGQVRYRFAPPALSEAEAAAGLALLCQAEPLGDLRLVQAPPEPSPPRQLPVRVQDRRLLSADVLALSLKLPRGEPFHYTAGQYVDILLDEGRSRRSFSMANPPGGETLELHLKLQPGGRFSAWAQDMPLKTVLRIEGPLGQFALRAGDTRRLLVAGGTGLAPLLAMLDSSLEQGQTCPTHLFWGVRAEADLYHHAALQERAARHAWLRYTPVLSAPGPGWAGATGLVHEAVQAVYPDLRGFAAYLAGPPAMIRAAQAQWPAAGLDPERLHGDAFTPAPAGLAAAPGPDGGAALT
jgi:CDP-4-dehydro-6-deoxyglucose reductase